MATIGVPVVATRALIEYNSAGIVHRGQRSRHRQLITPLRVSIPQRLGKSGPSTHHSSFTATPCVVQLRPNEKGYRTHMIEGMLRDVKYALRSFAREPAFVIGVLLTFALVIGANAATFSLVSRLMLSAPPGIQHAQSVFHLEFSYARANGESFVGGTTSYPVFRAVHSLTRPFAAVAAVASDTLTIGRGDDIARATALGVTGEYFAALGATPSIGRFLGNADDEAPGGASVALLGYAYWKRVYAGDQAVLGRQIFINDQPFIIIGVAAPNFNGDGMGPVDMFLPLSALFRNRADGWEHNHHMNIVSVVARLREGISPALAAQLAIAPLRDEAGAAGSDVVPSLVLQSLVPGSAERESAQARIALWLAAVSLIVLLIAAANIGTLLSLRSARRWREVAIRVAMGAGTARIARALLVESLLLAIVGGSIGLLLSGWIGQIIRATLLPGMANTEIIADHRVMIASMAATTAAGILAGLIPFVQIRRSDIANGLRAGSAHGASGRNLLQRTLVSVQVALSTVLLVAAALFVRSLNKVESQDLGFSTSKLLYATLQFRGFVSGAERDLAYEESVRRINATPGLASTVTAGIPFGPHNIPPVSIPGHTFPVDQQIPIMYGATPAYLAMMGVTLMSGRLLTERDNRGGAQVVLVNSTLAQTAWPGSSALGKCMRVGFGSLNFEFGDNPAETAPCREVVGVVRDSRARSLRPEGNEDRLMQYYVPFEQLPDTPMPDPSHVMGLIVRTNGDLDHAAALVERVIRVSSAGSVHAQVHRYQDLIDPQLRSWRLGATLFSAFGALALIIAAVGLFGVVSYVVSQRTREIGIRLAVGGTRANIGMLIIRDTLRMVFAGVAIGVLVALAVGRLMSSLLFQTSSYEPLSMVAAVGLLLLAALAAVALPAWRGGMVNPINALRAEG